MGHIQVVYGSRTSSICGAYNYDKNLHTSLKLYEIYCFTYICGAYNYDKNKYTTTIKINILFFIWK